MKRAYSQMGPGDRLFKVARANRGVSLGLLARKRQFKRSKLNRRGVSSQETGFVDLALTNFAMDTTGTIVLAATIAQGASTSQRVGKKVALKGIQIRGNVFANSAAVVPDGAWFLVYDKRPTGSLPGITDILVSAHPASFNNDANSGRFQILRRKDYSLSGNSTTPATGNEVADINEYIKLRGKSSVFKAAGTGAIGDIEEGALYLVSVGNVAAGTGAITAQIAARTRYVDV